ncbi:DNA breaking-rejoining protein [Serratia fonticola]|uniref:DNA breaking-rejoining protein n=1 Tax=Serratia fonticola TaxID=47917 RepID=UPI001AE8894B|nr:DNA breaking-rejoining protein [Serratia fonticola]MBP1015900.1 DNA breaking-rejoining protein [Serratia fonticola]CAI1932959.1 Uncharacterised protein [Serratia fonticola]
MANVFDRLVARMDLATAERMGRVVAINGQDYTAVESHLLLEMAQVSGDGISLVVFTPGYSWSRGDQAILDGQTYMVTRSQMFNGKPQIWLE